MDAGGIEPRPGGGEKSVLLVVAQRMRPRCGDVIDVSRRALPAFPGRIDRDDDVGRALEQLLEALKKADADLANVTRELTRDRAGTTYGPGRPLPDRIGTRT